MASKTTNRQRTKKKRDPLPEHFASIEEAAAFWDTHDSGDYDEYFVDVECEVELKKRTLRISVDGALYDEVRAIAKKKRIPADKLVSRWIKEKLRSAA
jgi:CopG antitoxin of type II toxin-antitoxin system